MKLALGIDIGGINTVFGLIDKQGKIIAERQRPTQEREKFDDYIADVAGDVKELLKQTGAELAGIGIGAPCGNNHNGTIENAANFRWKGVLPIAERFEDHFPEVPVYVTNDANAAAVGEMVYGNAKGMRDFIYITLGTGLGSGFVANGDVIYGHDGFAGELGHIIVECGGRDCGCGRKGCLETYVSATGIKRTVFELMANTIHKSELRRKSFDELTGEDIMAAALKGDPIALEAYEYTGTLLGRAIADAVAITSPQAVFLFGGLAKAGDFIFAPARKSMDENLLFLYKGKVEILPSGMGGVGAAILGASSLVWRANL